MLDLYITSSGQQLSRAIVSVQKSSPCSLEFHLFTVGYIFMSGYSVQRRERGSLLSCIQCLAYIWGRGLTGKQGCEFITLRTRKTDNMHPANFSFGV